jgi:hypothetical protein
MIFQACGAKLTVDASAAREPMMVTRVMKSWRGKRLPKGR